MSVISELARIRWFNVSLLPLGRAIFGFSFYCCLCKADHLS